MRTTEHVAPVFELSLSLDGPGRKKLIGPVKSALERLLLLRELDEFYSEVLRGDPDLHFIERLLRELDIALELGERDLAQIPRRGPLVIAEAVRINRNSAN